MRLAGLRAAAARVGATATRVGRRVGRHPWVRVAMLALDSYTKAGGGLLAGGLAYAALIAILPGLLLVIGVAGLVAGDVGRREAMIDMVARTFPPLADVARVAMEQVAAGAGPSSIVAIVGLVYGASRFYAALDEAFARVFRNAPARNPAVRWARAVISTALLVVLPVTAIAVGAMVNTVLDLAPIDGAQEAGRTAWRVASPVVTIVLFVVAVGAVYRLVPAKHIPIRALLPPAVAAGVIIGGFTQLFALLAPRLVGTAALFGAFVTVFALLAWLSISLNVLLAGAAWTRARIIGAAVHDEPDSADAAAPR